MAARLRAMQAVGGVTIQMFVAGLAAMPNCSHSSVIVKWSLWASTTKRLIFSMGVIFLQGIVHPGLSVTYHPGSSLCIPIPRPAAQKAGPTNSRDGKEDRGGEFAGGRNTIRATMKNQNHLIVWELLLLLASVLVFRSVWLLLDEMKWAREITGLLALLVPGVVLCVAALRAIHPNK